MRNSSGISENNSVVDSNILSAVLFSTLAARRNQLFLSTFVTIACL
jgi:hypothetical protein